jgi:hypothetical protein
MYQCGFALYELRVGLPKIKEFQENEKPRESNFAGFR